MEISINLFSRISRRLLKRQINNEKFDKIFTFFRRLDRKTEDILEFITRKKHIFLIIILNLILFIALLFLFKHYFIFEDYVKKLPSLLTAASIMISLTIGYLISKFFAIKEERRAVINKFRDLQYQFQPYQRAFDNLREHLYRRFPFEYKHSIPYKKLISMPEFWEGENIPCYGISFVRALFELTGDLFYFNDFDVDHRIIPKEQLLKYDEALSQLEGTLARRKHYKYLLKDFALDEQKDLDNNIVNSETPFVKISASKIAKEGEMSFWKTLEFWQIKFEEAHRLVLIMLNNIDFIQYYRANPLRENIFILLLSSIGGIFMPLILMFFNVSNSFVIFKYGLILFILGFVSILYNLSTELTSKSVYNLD